MPSITTSNLKEKLNSRLKPKLCCPEVVAVTLHVFPVCMNKACGKLIVVIQDEATTTCLQCNTTTKVSKCHCVFHCIVSLEEYPLNLPLEVLQMFFGERCHKNV